jgi:hypothetical protein
MTCIAQGGSVAHLHRLLAIESGSQVLYAGDHIYGDILRSKKQLGWRTMLVVPELEMELNLLSHTSAIRKEFQRLRQQGAALEGALQRLEWTFQFDDCTKDERERLSNDINSLQVCIAHPSLHRALSTCVFFLCYLISIMGTDKWQTKP